MMVTLSRVIAFLPPSPGVLKGGRDCSWKSSKLGFNSNRISIVEALPPIWRCWNTDISDERSVHCTSGLLRSECWPFHLTFHPQNVVSILQMSGMEWVGIPLVIFTIPPATLSCWSCRSCSIMTHYVGQVKIIIDIWLGPAEPSNWQFNYLFYWNWSEMITD